MKRLAKVLRGPPSLVMKNLTQTELEEKNRKMRRQESKRTRKEQKKKKKDKEKTRKRRRKRKRESFAVAVFQRYYDLPLGELQEIVKLKKQRDGSYLIMSRSSSRSWSFVVFWFFFINSSTRVMFSTMKE